MVMTVFGEEKKVIFYILKQIRPYRIRRPEVRNAIIDSFLTGW